MSKRLTLSNPLTIEVHISEARVRMYFNHVAPTYNTHVTRLTKMMFLASNNAVRRNELHVNIIRSRK